MQHRLGKSSGDNIGSGDRIQDSPIMEATRREVDQRWSSDRRQQRSWWLCRNVSVTGVLSLGLVRSFPAIGKAYSGGSWSELVAVDEGYLLNMAVWPAVAWMGSAGGFKRGNMLRSSPATMFLRLFRWRLCYLFNLTKLYR